MGVISFYRGNLHKVPDTPRRWPIPKPSISIQDFKILLEKRNKALQRLQLYSHEDEHEEVEGMGENGCNKEEGPKIGGENKRKRENSELEEENKRKRENSNLEDFSEGATECLKISEARQEKGYVNLSVDCEPRIVSKDGRGDGPDLSDSAKSKKSNAEEMDVDVDSHKVDRPGSVPDDMITKDVKPTKEAHKNPEEIANKLKKKHELESKLKDLTEEKHHLVQMLKHILSTEEEMKKRCQVVAQTSVISLTLPSQGEAAVDVGSHTKQAGRKIGTELNCYGDLEEGELDDACMPSPHSHNLHHVHGLTGPLGSVLGRQPNSFQQTSQSSQQLKTSLTVACHSQLNTTSSSVLMPSPSLLGAHGSHAQNVHIPPVPVSAAQIVVSSSSPATSSGTSIFRDTRRTSPSWNQR